jgi:hypothetical protein
MAEYLGLLLHIRETQDPKLTLETVYTEGIRALPQSLQLTQEFIPYTGHECLQVITDYHRVIRYDTVEKGSLNKLGNNTQNTIFIYCKKMLMDVIRLG